MKLEEYADWLKQNGNYEERAALQVVEKIVRWHMHDRSAKEYNVEVFPHHILTKNRERIEFDLVIEINYITIKHEFKRRLLVGVEFKEYDLQKAVRQAIRRRDFVDFMWIATRNVVADPSSLFYMVDFGIGWLIWDDSGFVKMLLAARQTYGNSVTSLVESIAERAIQRKLKEIEGSHKQPKLLEWLFE